MENQFKVVKVSGCHSKEVYFNWTLNDFSVSVCEGNCIWSPVFEIGLSSGLTKWAILINPNAPSLNSFFEDPLYSYATIYLMETPHPRLDVSVSYKLINSLGENVDFLRPVTGSMIKGTALASSSKLVWRNMLERFSHDNKITLIINLKVCVTNHSAQLISDLPITNSKLPFSDSSTIVKDFSKLLMDKESADFTIFVGENEFHAHKIILGARSPVFRSMFKHGTKEANEGKLKIKDIEPEVMEAFLCFIYTGNAKIEGITWELFTAADKYCVQDLKAFCENALIEELSIENCFNTLALSDFYSAENLKEHAMNFIVSNRHVVDKTGLEVIEDALAKEIVEAFLNQNEMD